MKVVLSARTPRGEIFFEVGPMRVTLGRTTKSLIKLPDSQCSAVHCRFWTEDGSIWVEDMESRNGTYINGVRMTRSQVFTGDKVGTGESIVTISSEHTPSDVYQKLAFHGRPEDRTSVGILLSTETPALRPPASAVARQKGRRLTTQTVIRVGSQADPQAEKWNESWRHWVAITVDITLITSAFVLPFAAMFWLDGFFEASLDPIDVKADLISSPRLASTSLLSLLLGVLVWSINTQNRVGTVGERLTGLADVPRELRKRN
jgi:hypothetical protein